MTYPGGPQGLRVIFRGERASDEIIIVPASMPGEDRIVTYMEEDA